MAGNGAPLMVLSHHSREWSLGETGDSCNSVTKKTCEDFFGRGVATGVTPPVVFNSGRWFVANSGPLFSENACCTPKRERPHLFEPIIHTIECDFLWEARIRTIK